MRKRLLYVGCLGYGNAGDDACLEGTRILIEPLLAEDWSFAAVNGYDFDRDEDFDAVLLGGGTLLSPHGNLGDAALQEAQRRDVPYYIFGTGLESAEWEGIPESDAMSSFVDMVGGARLIGVRGPQSQRELIRCGVPAQRIQIVGDPAVALEPQDSLRLPSQGPWIGVNVGTSFGRVFGGDEDKMRAVLANALQQLAEDGWAICFIPVWDRDLEVQSSAAHDLDGATLWVIDRVAKPVAIMGLLRSMDAVIAMKLHAGIFAAVAGTPYVPWAYRPKVEDFAHAAAIGDLVVRTDAPPDALVAAVHGAIQRRPEIRFKLTQAILEMRPRLREFACSVVDDIHPSGDAGQSRHSLVHTEADRP